MKEKMLAILQNINFKNVNIEAALGKRDKLPFDAEWIGAYERIQSLGALSEQAEVAAVRKLAHKQALAASGEPELADAVSDDFGLILSAALRDLDDGWINSLWWEYKSGRFPTGALATRAGRVSESIHS